MYVRILLTLAVIGMAALLISMRRMQTTARAVSPGGSPLRMPSELDARLDDRIAGVRLDGRFEDVVQTLADAARVQIVVRWDSLYDEDRDHRVRYSGKNVALGEVVQAIVAQLPDKSPVGFSAEKGVVVIDADHRFLGTTRFYNIRDIIEKIWPPIDQESSDTYDGPPGPGLFASVDSVSARIDELMELIRFALGPGTYDDNVGFSVVRSVNGVLVVTTSWSLHRKVSWFLDSLRASAYAPVKPTAEPIGEGRRVLVYAPEYEGAVAEELRVYDISAVERPNRYDQSLGELIGDIELGSWNENGGTAWSRQFGNQLLIRQTPAVHAKIAALLDELRRRGVRDGGDTGSTAAP